MRFASFTLVTGLLSIAQANNIIFYEINTCNSGDYGGCYNIGSGICCVTEAEDEAAAISISKGPLDFATMWSGGGCTTQQCVRALVTVVKIALTDLPLSNKVLVAQERIAVSGMVAICLLGDCLILCQVQRAKIRSLQ